MRFSPLLLLPLAACAVDPCPDYAGFVEGRAWTFEDPAAESTEVREIQTLDEDGFVQLRAVFTSPTVSATLQQRLQCGEDGVRLLEDTLTDEDSLRERSFDDPPLVLPAAVEPGVVFGGEVVSAETNAGPDEITFPEIQVEASEPLETPLGELEVLAFRVLGPNGEPLPEVGVLREAELGLVDILGGADLVSIVDE